MDGMDLMHERDRISRALSTSTKEMWKQAKIVSDAEFEYYSSRKKEAEMLIEVDRHAKSTAIDFAKGDDTRNLVAQKMRTMRLEQMHYEIMQEKLYILKLQHRSVESQIEREWSQSKNRV